MISVTILTKNSERSLKKTLDSLRAFDQVILLDSGSSDQTLEIAKSYPNVQIHSTSFKGFGPLHNEAAALASRDWIFSIDSDEIVTEELAKELLTLELDPSKVYVIERHNYFNGKRIKGCAGWSPDWVTRLYNKQRTRFSDALVHEKVIEDNLSPIRLKNPLLHTPYLEIADFLAKMQHYTALSAEQTKRRPPSFLKILLHTWHAFFKSYVLKGGFLAGKEGFIISAYNSHTTFYKYLKQRELSFKDPYKE